MLLEFLTLLYTYWQRQMQLNPLNYASGDREASERIPQQLQSLLIPSSIQAFKRRRLVHPGYHLFALWGIARVAIPVLLWHACTMEWDEPLLWCPHSTFHELLKFGLFDNFGLFILWTIDIQICLSCSARSYHFCTQRRATSVLGLLSSSSFFHLQGPGGNPELQLFVFFFRFKYHVLQTINHVVRLTLAYFVMLVVMSYNAWLGISVVVGKLFKLLVIFCFLEWDPASGVMCRHRCGSPCHPRQISPETITPSWNGISAACALFQRVLVFTKPENSVWQRSQRSCTANLEFKSSGNMHTKFSKKKIHCSHERRMRFAFAFYRRWSGLLLVWCNAVRRGGARALWRCARWRGKHKRRRVCDSVNYSRWTARVLMLEGTETVICSFIPCF